MATFCNSHSDSRIANADAWLYKRGTNLTVDVFPAPKIREKFSRHGECDTMRWLCVCVCVWLRISFVTVSSVCGNDWCEALRSHVHSLHVRNSAANATSGTQRQQAHLPRNFLTFLSSKVFLFLRTLAMFLPEWHWTGIENFSPRECDGECEHKNRTQKYINKYIFRWIFYKSFHFEFKIEISIFCFCDAILPPPLLLLLHVICVTWFVLGIAHTVHRIIPGVHSIVVS